MNQTVLLNPVLKYRDAGLFAPTDEPNQSSDACNCSQNSLDSRPARKKFFLRDGVFSFSLLPSGERPVCMDRLELDWSYR